jgi:hypothetical protein
MGCHLVVAIPNLVGFVKASSKAAFLSSSRSRWAIASTHSATDDVDVERPLRSIRLLQIIDDLFSECILVDWEQDMFRYHLQFMNVDSYAFVLSVCNLIEAALGFHHCSWCYECIC